MHDAIEKLKATSEESNARWEAERREDRLRHEERMDTFNKNIRPLLRPYR